MEQILVKLVGLERAQQLRDTPTLDLAHDNLWLVHLLIILYCHCRNEWCIELAARPTGEDLHICREEIHSLTNHLEHLHRLTEKLATFHKTEPVSPMGDQPEVPNNLNEGEDNAANPNMVEVNAEDVPANDGNNMAQAGVQGGQLSSIILFSGTKGLEALMYAEAIDGSLAQFGWTQAQAAQAAISRGGNAVANWIRGERAAGTTYTSWTAVDAGQRPLRPAFIARFGPVYTTSGAGSAIADLKQRNAENAAAFLNRVKIAVDILNYNVPEAIRNAAFRQGYARMVVAQLGGGLRSRRS